MAKKVIVESKVCPTASSCDNFAEGDCPFTKHDGKKEFLRRAYDTLSHDCMHICPRLLDHMADLWWKDKELIIEHEEKT